MGNSGIWNEEFKVRSYQMDMKARLTLTSIAGYLQELAGNHAHKNGFGYESMLKSGFIWVLTRLKIKVHKLPMWSEELLTETWVVNRAKFFSRRDFQFWSLKGELLISASTGWMLVDSKEKKPQIVDSFPMNIEIYPDKLAINEELIKIEAIGKTDSTSGYKVKYSDLDIVQHVNNIQYQRIILDAQPFELRSNYHVKSFEINYIAEALINDELEVLNQKLNGQQNYQHEIRKKSDQKIICRAIINWEKD